MNRLSLATLLLAITLGLPGCLGYRLGSMLPADIKTVYVPTFLNETTEPLIEIEATSGVIDELQKDGSLRVVEEARADSILKVKLTSFLLEPVAYDNDATATVNEYRMVLTASIVLLRRSNNQVLVEGPSIQGEAIFQVTGDMTSSKQTGLPKAVEDLGNRIVATIVEAW